MERREVVVAVGWSALTALVLLLAFALGQVSAGKSYRDGYKAAVDDLARCVEAGPNAHQCFEEMKVKGR